VSGKKSKRAALRKGTTPAISALAVIIIAVTLTGAITYEVLNRREDRVKARRLRRAAEEERGGLIAIEAAE
jgi:spermidine/putrescine transport system permease protein